MTKANRTEIDDLWVQSLTEKECQIVRVVTAHPYHSKRTWCNLCGIRISTMYNLLARMKVKYWQLDNTAFADSAWITFLIDTGRRILPADAIAIQLPLSE